jgi:hypothetical protein
MYAAFKLLDMLNLHLAATYLNASSITLHKSSNKDEVEVTTVPSSPSPAFLLPIDFQS